jgi:mannosylglycerate hydrolase
VTTEEVLGLNGLRHFRVVAHTHWDREWYAPFEAFQLRLAAVVDEVIDVLESDPTFTSFTLDGQAIVLEDYLEARPENESRLRALLESGRIEVGPSYVLPDELLVGAEPLVRNLLIGRAVCERFGAQPAPVGYMPDSFGHPLQLPQVLAGFGIDSFIFSRGLGDELDDLGVVFRWRSPDGSEVRAFQQLPHYGNFVVGDADDAQARAEEIADRFGAALRRAGIHDVLLCNGEDHRRIRTDLPALCAELERRLPGTSFAIARFTDYVAETGTGDLPAWTGELLGSRLQNVLRGVNSARLYIKQANERAERRLLEVETLVSLSTLQSGAPFPVSDFRLAWRQLLKCQPHDSICGCSCDEVHDDMLVRYGQLDRTLGGLTRHALAGFTQPSPAEASAAVVVNLLPYRRRGLIELPGTAPAMVEVDGFSARPLEPTPASAPPTPRTPYDGAAIESDDLRVEAAPDGTLTLLDMRTGRRYEQIHRLEDEPDVGDLYNFCPVDGAAVWRSTSAAVRVLRDGPLVHELELQFTGDEAVAPAVTTIVRLIDGIRRVEFRTTIDNRTEDHRLRAAFPVDEHEEVRAEGQFAVVHRPHTPPLPRTDWAEPPDPTHHTLGAVAIGPLALLTKGLPEYEARGEELCLTLLRCVGTISRPAGAIATRPICAGPPTHTPGGQCLGRHELEYALLPGADELDDAELLRAAQDYRHGFLVIQPPVWFDPALAIDGDVVFSCLKGAEDGDGLILRCFNPKSTATRMRIAGDLGVTRARLDETETVARDALELGPSEVATFRLRPRA